MVNIMLFNYTMPSKTTVIIGDGRRMGELSDRSIHLVITSPPYWQLKDYGSGDQIGFNDSYEDYINNLNLVWKECHRVLHNGCRLCVNIGDQFARSVYYGRYKVIPIREEIIRFCETIGFDYMGAIIWQKVTTCNTTGGATIMGSFPYPRNGIIKLDYEFILVFKKSGDSPKVSRDIRERSRLSTKEWNEYFYGHWNFPGEKQQKHLAMFPEELPKRLIKMFSFIGDTVLDPFLGSGTTCLAARNMERNSVGYEINKDFLPVISEKLAPQDVTEDVEILYQSFTSCNFTEEIEGLPYVFKDPVRFDKKIDPKQARFGSRIDDSDHSRETYYSVSEIVSPEVLLLDNGMRIRLIGLKNDHEGNGKALAFLKEKLTGQKVFLRFDATKYDDQGNMMCYVYLKNKTFINAHLIKNGLAAVDSSVDFRYRKKFLGLSETAEKRHSETS
jgi:DNA modification methylase